MPGDSNTSDPKTPDAISALVIEGFKSLAERTEIEIRPLTLLAGANSSGKSSVLQPLLMLKQTLEATFDPGALLLDGPNTSFTDAEQLFSQLDIASSSPDRFSIGIHLLLGASYAIKYNSDADNGITISSVDFDSKVEWYREGETLAEINARAKPEKGTFHENMTRSEIKAFLPPHLLKHSEKMGEKGGSWTVERRRCFLGVEYTSDNGPTLTFYPLQQRLGALIQHVIYVPGLRDHPSRTYKKTAVGNRFPGTFDDYVASVIHSWQREGDECLEKLVRHLQHMGLTGGVEADRVNDTQVELRVEQQPIGSDAEGRMINVADVGLGVSQVLPVLVACLVADEGQLVYLEQPEIHLHPRAQTRLADVLVEAANRGVRVVVETHSQLLLLALQTRVAEDQIDPERVMLHWFSRREDGATEVNSRQPDEKGAFGDWPEDFSEVEMEAENRYLDAAERHLFEE